MYNTDFKVKYFDIREELLCKLTSNSETYSIYTEEDILDICNKLYRDELTCVFYAEDITDDKIDSGIKFISEKMMANHEFNIVLNELRIKYHNWMSSFPVDSDNKDHQNIDFIIFLTLFSNKIFYIMHKCICQQLLVEKIDHDLLTELKKLTLESIYI